ncbi:hypothetical protein Taro_031252 [Colocasia esculenta]|uniref:Ionotropic glutamate receptor C-terminal domain-containing protein n=1 Tax=Colocasia esculenta TaxID=4460 RepID=A0A843VYJ3_COLES|nr:hypothetical protein [Colocasia esculenta]
MITITDISGGFLKLSREEEAATYELISPLPTKPSGELGLRLPSSSSPSQDPAIFSFSSSFQFSPAISPEEEVVFVCRRAPLHPSNFCSPLPSQYYLQTTPRCICSPMRRKHTHLLLFLFALCFCSCSTHRAGAAAAARSAVHVGVILDLHKDALVGRMYNTSLAMAVENFYAKNPNYTTRVVLHPRDSNRDVVGAASAALDLMKNVRVQAIIGPLTSVQSVFVIDLGNKTHVPIVSFSASSPTLSPTHSPYFVRATLNSSSQVEAIAAIVRAFGWPEVVPVYEDTEYGAGFLPYLVDAFQAVDARVPYRSAISPSATDEYITAELNRLADRQTRVFVVHMLTPLGSRLFRRAKELGMMEKGYVWIATDGLTDQLGTLKPDVVEAMEGVIGLKPYVPPSPELKEFTAQWSRRFRRDNPDAADVKGFSTHALWAYDTAWAMAKAVEKAGLANSSGLMRTAAGTSSGSSTDLAKLVVSPTGPRLLKTLLETKFWGLSGEFRLVDGQLQASTFRVVNIVDGVAREVGFWTPADGVTPELNSTVDKQTRYTNEMALRKVVWPGRSTDLPKGWQMPTGKKTLQIAIPAKAGFGEFVHVDGETCPNGTKCPNATGYSIEVFDAVMKSLNYGPDLYDYIPFEAQGESGSYDFLVQQIYLGNYDAAVGDITIVANRSQDVDFTLPYTESGVSMIVPVKKDKNKNAWIFLKPLTTDLWLGSLAFFFFTGFVVWVIEHRINEEFRGPPAQQMGTIFYFAFSTMVYAHSSVSLTLSSLSMFSMSSINAYLPCCFWAATGESLASNLSRFVVIIWVFVVLILTSSYTASLTSMLTVQQLQPAVTDVSQLLKNGDRVGYQDGSFVRGLLLRLNFHESKLVPYVNSSQYAEALSKGSHNGGVAAIVDEIPYIKVFMADHCKGFMEVGPISKTDGFGFVSVFPRGSPIVPEISRAILNITEGTNKLQGIETWLGKKAICSDQAEALNSNRLSFGSFWGLFLITGGVSFLALFIYFATFVHKNWDDLRSATSTGSLWERMKACGRHYDQKDRSSHTFKEGSGADHKGCDCASHGRRTPEERSTAGDASQSPISISVHSFMNCGPREEAARTSISYEGGHPSATTADLAPSEPPTIPVTQIRDWQ